MRNRRKSKKPVKKSNQAAIWPAVQRLMIENGEITDILTDDEEDEEEEKTKPATVTTQDSTPSPLIMDTDANSSQPKPDNNNDEPNSEVKCKTKVNKRKRPAAFEKIEPTVSKCGKLDLPNPFTISQKEYLQLRKKLIQQSKHGYESRDMEDRKRIKIREDLCLEFEETVTQPFFSQLNHKSFFEYIISRTDLEPGEKRICLAYFFGEAERYKNPLGSKICINLDPSSRIPENLKSFCEQLVPPIYALLMFYIHIGYFHASMIKHAITKLLYPIICISATYPSEIFCESRMPLSSLESADLFEDGTGYMLWGNDLDNEHLQFIKKKHTRKTLNKKLQLHLPAKCLYPRIPDFSTNTPKEMTFTLTPHYTVNNLKNWLFTKEFNFKRKHKLISDWEVNTDPSHPGYLYWYEKMTETNFSKKSPFKPGTIIVCAKSKHGKDSLDYIYPNVGILASAIKNEGTWGDVWFACEEIVHKMQHFHHDKEKFIIKGFKKSSLEFKIESETDHIDLIMHTATHPHRNKNGENHTEEEKDIKSPYLIERDLI